VEVEVERVMVYVVRRIVGAIPLLLLICVISYALMELSPGGPGAVLGSARVTPEARSHLVALLGLDKPWYVQFFYWLHALILHGSLGYSYVDNRPVLTDILDKLPVTLELVGLSLLLTVALAIPVGVYAATHRDSWADRLASTLAFGAYGMPIFWLGILLINAFSVHLRWLPASGVSSLGKEHDAIDRMRHLVLPVLTLTIGTFAAWMRYQRAAMIEVLGSPFIRTARAKGLSNHIVIFRHALRNALLPMITLLGLSLSTLVTGAYFTEYVFSLPGLGLLGLNSVFARDYPVVMGIALLSAVLVVAGNLLADLAYAVADPRIHYD
jgi:peptide/nickel transport system permease protein